MLPTWDLCCALGLDILKKHELIQCAVARILANQSILLNVWAGSNPNRGLSARKGKVDTCKSSFPPSMALRMQNHRPVSVAIDAGRWSFEVDHSRHYGLWPRSFSVCSDHIGTDDQQYDQAISHAGQITPEEPPAKRCCRQLRPVRKVRSGVIAGT